MDTTTNYSLKKPAYTDGADIEILSENFDTIDQKLKETNNKASSAVQSATFGGTAVPKIGTALQIPMPSPPQMGAQAIARTVVPSMSSIANVSGGGQHYMISGTSSSGTPTNTNIWLVDILQEGWGEVAVAYGVWDASVYVCWRNTIDSGATFFWSPWKKPDAEKADYASGSVPLTTPGVRNIIGIPQTDSIPAGLAEDTIILRYIP